ncbi:hypothetical protein GVAV_001055 [Gurleya vavrai]
MLENEKSESLKCELSKLIVLCRQHNFIKETEIFEALKFFNLNELNSLTTELKNEKSVNQLVRLFKENKAIEFLNLNTSEIKEFLNFILENENITKEEINNVKYLVKDDHDILNELFLLLKKYKEDYSIINIIFESIIKFKSELIMNEEFVDFIISIIDNTKISLNILKILKKIENNFKSKISLLIENLKIKRNKKTILYAIRFFDLSEIIDESFCLEANVLASFWNLKNEKYYIFNIECKNEFDYKYASDFLLYCYSVIKDIKNLDEETVYDFESGMKKIFYLLKKSILKFLDIIKISDRDYFLKSKESNKINIEPINEFYDFKEFTNDKIKTLKDLFTSNYIKTVHILNDKFEILYYANKEEILKAFSLIKENDDILIIKFFEYLEYEKNYEIGKIKSISQELSKKVKEANIFSFLKKLNNQEILYDNCFYFFVKFLSNFECNELFDMVRLKCKYKNELEKRMEKTFGSSLNEKKDVIYL